MRGVVLPIPGTAITVAEYERATEVIGIVLHSLCPDSYWIVHMAVENLMELKDVILRDGNGIKALMDDAQHISIACDFLLIAVLWRGLLLNQLSDTCIGCNNAFNSVRCLRALNLGDFNQLLKLFRFLL